MHATLFAGIKLPNMWKTQNSGFKVWCVPAHLRWRALMHQLRVCTCKVYDVPVSGVACCWGFRCLLELGSHTQTQGLPKENYSQPRTVQCALCAALEFSRRTTCLLCTDSSCHISHVLAAFYTRCVASMCTNVFK